MGKYDYTVEIIEEREGVRSIWNTTGKMVRAKDSQIASYDVKGLPRLIPVPDYSHTFVTKKGRHIKFYSPDPDTFQLVKFKPEAVELGTTKDEYAKNWFNMKVKQSHERWTKDPGLEKWLPIIMLIIIALIFVMGIRFATESFQASAEASASAQIVVAQTFDGYMDKWVNVTKSCESIIVLYEDVIRENRGELARPLQIPPG